MGSLISRDCITDMCDIDFHIVSSSPEILARLDNGSVTVRPLAGTRRRGRNETEDKLLEEELLADPKEIAEHLMLVDLGRNDIGRVCEVGSVQCIGIAEVLSANMRTGPYF